jgi:Mrp family chromosome partitioning ATPase
MIEANTEVVLGESKIASLQGLIQELNTKIDAVPKKQAEYAELQRKDDMATNTLSAIEAELERVKLTESVATASSRMQVVDSNLFYENSRLMGMMISFGIAIFLAAGSAVAMRIFDPRLLSPAFLRDYRVIGSFPKLTGGSEEGIQLADRLRPVLKGWMATSKVLWVTSATRQDGKSLIAYSLAESFADAGMAVVLIDANLRQPKLHVSLGEAASPGLHQYLESEATLANVIRQIRPNFDFVPAGGIIPTLRPVAGQAFETLVHSLSQNADVVIVDSAAAGEDEFGLVLADVHPNVLVVARIANTIRSSLQTVLDQMQLLNVGEVGVVLNGANVKDLNKIRRGNTMVSTTFSPGINQTAPQDLVAAATDDSSAPATW